MNITKKILKQSVMMFIIIILVKSTLFMNLPVLISTVNALTTGEDEAETITENEAEMTTESKTEVTTESETEVRDESADLIIYDLQPTTEEEVKNAIDAYLAANSAPDAKPHWEFEVSQGLMPVGWRCDYIEDKELNIIYWTFFLTSMPTADVVVSSGNPADLSEAIRDAPIGNTTINITKDINLNSLNTTVTGGLLLTAAIEIPIGKNITLTSDNDSQLIKSTPSTSDMTSRHFAVKGTLTLQNITLNGEGKGGGVDVSIGTKTVSGGTFFMKEGAVIENCYSEAQGGGVLVAAYATFIMDGGQIKNCVTNISAGGGVSVFGQAYGTAESFGIANFTMNGGIIRDNKANSGTQGGGGLLVSAANVTMNGGIITGNDASGQGGGVRIVCRPTQIIPSSFTMNGGTISDNKTAVEGGGVLVLGQGGGQDGTGASFTMNGGKITQNKSSSNGGGVAVIDAYSEFIITNINRVSSINSNTTGSSGGGVYVDKGKFKLNEGTLGSNVADKNGGGVYVTTAGVFTMGNAKINGNSALKGDGGGIYTEVATYLGTGDYVNLTIAGTAQFSGNRAQVAYIYNGTPVASNIASRNASFNFPDDTTPYITHPLNNYDINYVRETPLVVHTVTVEYKDSAGIELLPSITGQFVKDTEYTYTIPLINKYEMVESKWNGESKGNTNLITSFPITEDIVITLIYEQVTNFGFYKVDAKDDTTFLKDAEFKLYFWAGNSDPDGLVTDEAESPDWKLKGTYLSNADGYVDFGSLPVGVIYQLAEVKAPIGYQLPMGQWRITVSSNGIISDPVAVGQYKPPAFKNTGTNEERIYLLGNRRQYSLALTGGRGTFWITVLGSLMLIIGAVCFFVRLRHGLKR